jgi:hypothetical protein
MANTPHCHHALTPLCRLTKVAATPALPANGTGCVLAPSRLPAMRVLFYGNMQQPSADKFSF